MRLTPGVLALAICDADLTTVVHNVRRCCGPTHRPGAARCVGLCNEADGQRLPVLDATGMAIDDQVFLGYQVLP